MAAVACWTPSSTSRTVIVSSAGSGVLPCGSPRPSPWKSTTCRGSAGGPQAAGEVDPALSSDYCAGALLSAAVGGALSFCYLAELGQSAPALPQHLHTLIRRALQPER